MKIKIYMLLAIVTIIFGILCSIIFIQDKTINNQRKALKLKDEYIRNIVLDDLSLGFYYPNNRTINIFITPTKYI